MASVGETTEVDATNIDEIPGFIHEIFNPLPLTSFREGIMPSGELEILLHRVQGEAPRPIRLINMFPFMTLKDIKLALCLELNREFVTVPEYIYLCSHGPRPGEEYSGGTTQSLDFSWNLPGLTSKNPFRIKNPFALASGSISPEEKFVDSAGERKLVSFVDRERMTIEDACFKKGVTKGIPEIHAYLYEALLNILPGNKPPSEKDWNGRLYPMFPYLSVESGSTPSAELRDAAQRQATIFLRRQQFMVKIESILESNIPLVSLTMAGIKYLQLGWYKIPSINGIETQFYEANVTERRPFFRLIPTEGVGISKVYLSNGKTPDIQDPQLLVQWSQDRSPTPERDYAFAKILIRKGLINVQPIYSTLRLFDDGTADCIIEPPKGMKKMEPRNDLYSLGEQITEGLQDLPYIKNVPELEKGAFVLGLKARRESSAIITARILHERLPIFSAMFQEIAPLPGEKPLVMLRFKLVSNFAREDRIQTFLTQVMNRKILRGEGGIGDLISLVSEEFQLDLEEARKQVSMKLRNQGEVSLVVPETKEYMRQNNTGIDVAIFAQHPFYTFHLYNVNSLENLRRIVTALSILISADSDSLQVGSKAVKELLKAESREDEESSKQEEEIPGQAEAETEAEAQPEAEAEVQPEAIPAEQGPEATNEDDVPDYLDYFAFDKDDAEVVEEGVFKNEVIAAAKIEGQARPDPPFDKDASLKPMPTMEVRKQIERGYTAPQQELADTSLVSPLKGEDADRGTASETGIANYFLNKLKAADSRLFEYNKINPALKRYVSQCQPTYGRQPAVLSEEKYEELKAEYMEDNITFQEYPLKEGEPQKLAGTPEVDYFTVLKYGSTARKQNYYICSKYFCTRDEMVILEKDLVSTKMRRPKGAAKLPGQCPFCKGTVIKNRQHPGLNETILERVIKPPTHDKRHIFIGFLKRTPHPEGFYLPCCFTENIPINFNRNPSLGVDAHKEARQTNVRATTATASAFLDQGYTPHAFQSQPLKTYDETLNEAVGEYIVGAEKLPLDPADLGAAGEEKLKKWKEELFKREKDANKRQEELLKQMKKMYKIQIGVLPEPLNAYFDQTNTDVVSKKGGLREEIKPGGTGFLRIAVENRHRYQNDSFLSAVAPFYGKQNSAQMKQNIINVLGGHIIGSISEDPNDFFNEVIKIVANAEDRQIRKIRDGFRAFLGLNYGNLAIEFYNPLDPQPTEGTLRLWASTVLNVTMHQENEGSLMRAAMSYRNFYYWLLSDTQKKEYRHFALFFAQTSLREDTDKGITFIILDILQNGALSVRCPPYGFNGDVMAKNDVAFIFHHWSGIWEPIFYFDNREEVVKRREVSLFHTLVFQYDARATWPKIVRKRVQEFTTQCTSPGRAVYTSQSNINPQALIPASLIRNVLQPYVIFDGVIRDAYNHIGAFVFRDKSDNPEYKIAVPVVDDGTLIVSENLYMDWQDPSFEPAPIDVVLRFYAKYIKSLFSYYSGYEALEIIKSEESGLIEAIQLRNRLYVPVSPPSSQSAEEMLEGSRSRLIKELEWQKNHEISLETGSNEMPNEKHKMRITEFQEVFEHVRLTFSNWFAAQKDAGDMRKTIEKVIFSSRLPLYEKRKRMEILLSRPFHSWITTDFSDEDTVNKMNTSLLRVDCTLKEKEQCNGRCAWVRDIGTPGDEQIQIHKSKDPYTGNDGKCLLHVPKTTTLGENTKNVSAPRVLLLRLIEELLRYGERRRQLLNQDVARLANLDKPIVINVPGEKARQIIYPEKSSAWYELLRLEWAKVISEKPKFLEEMSREKDETALAEMDSSNRLPERLETLLNGPDGEDPKTGAIRLLRAPFDSLFIPLRIKSADIGLKPDTSVLSDDMLRKISEQTAGMVFQIDLRKDPPVLSGKKPKWTLYISPGIPIFIITEEGPGILVLNPSAPKILSKEDIPTVFFNKMDTISSGAHKKTTEGSDKDKGVNPVKWIRKISTSTGNVYWYNPETKQSSWVNPETGEGAPVKKVAPKVIPPAPDAFLQQSLEIPANTVAAPAEQAPMAQAPVEQAPMAQAPVEQAPVEQAPVEQAPMAQAPVEQVPVEEAPVEEAPVEQVPVEQVPVEQVPVEQVPVEQVPVEQVPVEQVPVEQAPVDQAAVEQAPVEEPPMAEQEPPMAEQEPPMAEEPSISEQEPPMAEEESK